LNKKNLSKPVIFFVFFLILGLLVFRDYGLSWDEPAQRKTGFIHLRHALKRDQLLSNYEDRDYGPAFEMGLTVIERVFNLKTNLRRLYLVRHLVTFLSFYSGLIFFYLLAKSFFKSSEIALLGCFFLVISPRIFGHSFYNSKDLPFLSFFIISVYTLRLFLDKKNLKSSLSHALACALLSSIRIAGLMVPLLTVFLFLWELTLEQKNKKNKKIAPLLVFIFPTIFLTILFQPFLWQNPVNHLLEILQQMNHFRWNQTVLYRGQFLRADNLPWHYLPVWIIITTPLLYLFLFLLGSWRLMRLATKTKKRSWLKRDVFIFFLWFYLPLTGVILSKSVLYDGWRHLFFIYPAFLLIALQGAVFFIKKSPYFLLLILLGLIEPLLFMIKYHPYQNVYFNRLAGRNMKQVKDNFELDYWGLSYRQALEYILEHDQDKEIKVAVANAPGRINADLLVRGKERLVYVDQPEQAKYFLTNYRWHPQDYSYQNEFYVIKVGGAKIMVVYKIND